MVEQDDVNKKTCACSDDYHLADCPIVTGGGSKTSEDYFEQFSDPEYDPYYDDDDY